MAAKRASLNVRRLAAVFLFAVTASAQTVVDLAQLPAAVRNLDPNQAHPTLPCTIRKVDPTLNFGFVLQTGYVLRAPVDVCRGAGHRWYEVFRVTPEGGTGLPIYFMDTVDLPAFSNPDSLAAIRGLFLVGEGHYDVNFSLLDDLGRICRQSWTIEAKPGKNDHATDAMLPTGTVAGISSQPARAPIPNSRTHPGRITVILNVLPAAPRFMRTGKPDGEEWLLSKWGTLLSMLTSLVEQNPADSVRVVGFNLAQQRESFRQDGFTLQDVNRAVHIGHVLDQGPAGDPALPNPTRIRSFFVDLVNREIHAEPPSDAVIIMGTPMGCVTMPHGFPGEVTAASPRFFYLQYRTNPPGAPVEVWDDAPSGSIHNPNSPLQSGYLPNAVPPLDYVADYMREVKGHTFVIYSADDFDKALRKIEDGIR